MKLDFRGLKLKAFAEIQAPFQFPKEGFPTVTLATDPEEVNITGTWQVP